MHVEVEEPPQSGKVSRCVAGGHVTPVQHCAQVSLADQHVTRMEVTMDPDSLGRSCCQESGVEETNCFGYQRLVPARQWLLSPHRHSRLTRREGTTAGRVGRNVFGRRHVQGRQEGAKRSRFSGERGRRGSTIALEPRNDTPGPGELGAGNADDHRRWDRQRKSGR